MKIKFAFFLICLPIMIHAQENQNIEISKLASGNYPVYKTVEKGFEKYNLELATKPWPVEFIKEGEVYEKVSVKRAGIINETFSVDLPNFPAYYQGGNADIIISIIDKKIYYYVWSAKTGAKINYILSNEKPSKYIEEKSLLDNYRRNIKNLQVDARENRIEENLAIAEKEAQENTLEGKEIKVIRVKLIGSPSEIGLLTVVAIGVEFELTNGTVLKTKNLGGKTPYTDFESIAVGGDFAGGDFKIANDSREIPNDKIEITVWSKYDSKKIKGSLSVPVNYKNDIFYQFQGKSGNFGRGATVGYSEHGSDGTDGKSINITIEKLQINGGTVYKISIMDALSGEFLSEAKVHENNKITLNVSGGNGGNGCSGNETHSGNGGNGGNGGDGGDVYVTENGSSDFNLIVLNSGGKAGRGGAPKFPNSNTAGSNGSSGNKGSFNK